MVKFMHTADWHLGIKFSQLGSKADAVREMRIKTAEKLLEAAKESNVDFVLISGDLFDSNNIERRTLNRVIQLMLKASPLDVYILPGNHDPLTLDSPYLYSAWDSLSNVHILKDPEPLNEVNSGVVLYPCPITQKQSSKDLTEWINANNSEISIGIAHGNIEIEGFIDASNFPIDPERADKSGLNYLALGEWHSFYEHTSKDGQIKTVYPGTPETTKFGEKNSGNAVIVEINDSNDPPVINEINTGSLNWVKNTETIYSEEDLLRVHSTLQEISNPENTILKLSINGITDQEIRNEIESLAANYESNFMFLDIDMHELYLQPNSLEFKAMIPEGTILSHTFDALLALMKYHPRLQEYSNLSPEKVDEIFQEIKDHESIKQVSPEILQRAILILYRITMEVSK